METKKPLLVVLPVQMDRGKVQLQTLLTTLGLGTVSILWFEAVKWILWEVREV